MHLSQTVSIEFRHLRYADAAARHGSFREAADSLSCMGAGQAGLIFREASAASIGRSTRFTSSSSNGPACFFSMRLDRRIRLNFNQPVRIGVRADLATCPKCNHVPRSQSEA
jgi:hypothetical protein